MIFAILNAGSNCIKKNTRNQSYIPYVLVSPSLTTRPQSSLQENQQNWVEF